MTQKKDDRTERTFKQGLVGGVLGAFIGVPGLGAGLGIANANKDKIKELSDEVDENISQRRLRKRDHDCKKCRARDNPADWF